MNIAVLSTKFVEGSEVEEDLTKMGSSVVKALEKFGYTAKFFDVNEKTFEMLRNSDFNLAFNVCERFNGNSYMEPHVAAMLELLGIPYTGSGPLALSLCMNKPRVKDILLQNSIPTPKFQIFYSKNKKLNPDLKFPLIVKPVAMDNSIGITEESIVYDERVLAKKVASINRVYNQPAMVEEFICGREFAVAVLGNNGNAKALPISEFIFPDDKSILSYNAKWDFKSDEYIYTPEICPAQIPKYLEQRMKKIALDVHRILEVRDYSRIDLRLGEDGTPYVLEMNPNPGISADNTIPKAAKSLGITYDEMINEILCRGLERHRLEPLVPSKISSMKTIIPQRIVCDLDEPPV